MYCPLVANRKTQWSIDKDRNKQQEAGVGPFKIASNLSQQKAEQNLEIGPSVVSVSRKVLFNPFCFKSYYNVVDDYARITLMSGAFIKSALAGT